MWFRAGHCGPESEIGGGGRLRSRNGLVVRDPRSRVSTYPLGVDGIYDGDGFGMLVLQVMFLCVNLFMLLKVLRSFEGFLADFADVRLEWGMDTEMASYVITLSTSSAAVLPPASKAEIIGALTTDVVVAEVVI